VALAGELPDRVHNLNVEVKEWQDEIVFLHRIVPGSADKSYGIHVARLAGIPDPVIERARGILEELEMDGVRSITPTGLAASSTSGHPIQQPSLFQEDSDPLRDLLKGVNPDEISPREAQDLLYRVRDLLR